MKARTLRLIDMLSMATTFKVSEISDFIVLADVVSSTLEDEIERLVSLGVTDLSQYNNLLRAGLVTKPSKPQPVRMDIPHDVADIIESFLRAHKKKRMSYYKSNKVHDWVDKAGYFQVGIKSVTHTLDWAEC